MEAFVDIDGVTLKYRGASGDIVALQDATLKVQRGEFAAVVGPSGCGKSTLMRLVTGLHKPTAGTIAIDGKQVTGPVKMAGMAFQNANMLPWRKVIDNVLLPLEIVEPHRSQFRSKKWSSAPRPSSFWLPSVSPASATAIPGSCPVACNSACRCAAR